MTTSPSILYVEDNFDNRLLVKRLLSALGYQLWEAEDARQAMKILSTHTPDLILVDINLPEVDGLTFTREIKALPALKSIPIVALTANVMRGDKDRALQAGCDGYIEKPIDVDHFIEQISAFCLPEHGTR